MARIRDKPGGSGEGKDILLVSHYFWPEEFRVNELAVGLTRRGHRVTVATGTPNYPGHRQFSNYRRNPRAFAFFAEAIPVIRFPILSIGSSKIGLAVNYISLAFSMCALAPWVFRRRSFDAVICFQPSPFTVAIPALLLSWLKRAPLVLWVLDCWPETLEAIGVIRRPWLIRAVGAVVGAVYRRCALVLGQSQSFATSIRRWSGQANFRYFPNWVEDVYTRADAPRRSSEAPHVFTIVFAGNIGEAQDFPAVVAAMDMLRDAPLRWIVAGGGRRANWLYRILLDRGLTNRVIMTGRLPTPDMPALFQQGNALLVSLAPEPIFAMTVPGKVPSYMAAGKPILGMLDGEGKALIEEVGCGLTAPAGDARGLANNILRLMEMDAEEREGMGERGRDYASRYFDREALIDSLENWIDEAAGGVGAAAIER